MYPAFTITQRLEESRFKAQRAARIKNRIMQGLAAFVAIALLSLRFLS